MDVPLRVGNEGAGVVTAVGMDSDEDAWELLGKTVGILGGQMYTQYRVVPYKSALELLQDTSPAEGASAFVNPLTVLGMIETMRDEGHTAIVHTAAASQLGQMLVRACANEGIPLVNVVRRPEQVSLLSGLGAEHVVDSSSEEFMDDLVNAISATGATVGFDATGGGTLASQILTAMERSAVAAAGASQPGNRYGSDTFKQLYIYGGLDTTETRLNRSYGMRWGVGGWLLGPNFLERVGPERADAVRPPPHPLIHGDHLLTAARGWLACAGAEEGCGGDQDDLRHLLLHGDVLARGAQRRQPARVRRHGCADPHALPCPAPLSRGAELCLWNRPLLPAFDRGP